MEPSHFFPNKVTNVQVPADDIELETLLQRTAEFLRSRRLSADHQQDLARESCPGRDVILGPTE
jgi:hypothetical protein